MSGQRDKLSLLKPSSPGSATTLRLLLKNICSPPLDNMLEILSLIRSLLGLKKLPIKAVANMDMNSRTAITTILVIICSAISFSFFYSKKQFYRNQV